MKHYIFLTLFLFLASLAHGQVVTITQSGSGAGIDTTYQRGDSVFIVSAGDTIFSGLAGVDVALAGVYTGLKRIANDSLGLDLGALGSPFVITGTDRFAIFDPESGANAAVRWDSIVGAIRDSVGSILSIDADNVNLSPSITYESGTASTVQEALELQQIDVSSITGENYRTNSISYTGQISNVSGGDWGEWGKYINAFDHLPDSLYVTAGASSTIYVNYYRFGATSGTIIDRDTFSVVSGVNRFQVDTTHKNLSVSRLYVTINTVSTGGLLYKSSSPDSVGFQIISGTINKYPFSFSYYLTYKPTVPLQEQADRLRIWTSVGNDTVSWRDLKNAIDNYDIVNLPAQTIWIPFKISLTSSIRINGVKGSSILRLSGNNSIIFEADDKTNISIQGVTFQGRQSSIYNISSSSVLADSASIRARTNMGSQYGLVIKASNNIYLADLEFNNFNGAGMDHRTSETTPVYVNNVQANGLWFYNCYIGLFINEGEYSNYNTVAANNCLMGCYIEGGNNTVTNVNLSNCRVGLVISELTGNSAHGSILGGSVNHNALYGLYCLDIATGENIVGLQHWSNGNSAWIKNGKAVKLTGCHFSNNIVIDGGYSTVVTGSSFATDVKPTTYGSGSIILSANSTLLSSQNNVNNSPPIQLSGTGSPVGAVTPNYSGQDYLDTSGNIWWKSKGITNTDWLQLN